MGWKWEEFTAPDLVKAQHAVDRTCVVPLGVLEKHGDHLPVGTDALFVTRVTEEATALEPVVQFPTFLFGQILEAKPFPGTIAIRHDLMAALLLNLCEEISRNGFTKIILLNGHGGNESFLANFTLGMLDQARPFTLYTVMLSHYLLPLQASPEWKAMTQSGFDDHGGEMETSLLMAVRPDLVKMKETAPPGTKLNRMAHVPASTPVWWYADYPEHYGGDATHATPDKGAYLMQKLSQRLAEIFKAVKSDTTAPRLMAEFFRRSQH